MLRNTIHPICVAGSTLFKMNMEMKFIGMFIQMELWALLTKLHRIGFDRDRRNGGSSESRHSDSGSSGRGYGSPRSQDKRVIYLEPSVKGRQAHNRY